MNKTLEVSAMQYDFHTLLKVSDICGLTGKSASMTRTQATSSVFPMMTAKPTSGWLSTRSGLSISKTTSGTDNLWPAGEIHIGKREAPSAEIVSAEGAVIMIYRYF